MPAPLYGADDARRCSGNSVSEVLDKFRKNYDRIMSLPQETKEEKEFRHCIWLAEKEERERIYQTSSIGGWGFSELANPVWSKFFGAHLVELTLRFFQLCILSRQLRALGFNSGKLISH